MAPAVSGIAGLLGVLLSALLFSDAASALLEPVTGAARSVGSWPALAQVFDLSGNRPGIMFAILFGWAPTLLQARLDRLSDSYKDAIKSTELGQRR
jgi:hypothetical protein